MRERENSLQSFLAIFTNLQVGQVYVQFTIAENELFRKKTFFMSKYLVDFLISNLYQLTKVEEC